MLRRSLFVWLAVSSVLGSIASVADANSAPAPAAVPELLTAVSCATPSVCFAAGVRSFEDGSIVRTTDGGRSWTRLAAPSTAHLLNGIACPTTRSCVVVGDTHDDMGAVYATRTGGEHWHRQDAPFRGGIFLAVACAARLMCEATGIFDTVFGTVDGGNTWTKQPVPHPASRPSSISCPTTIVCAAVGDTGDFPEKALVLRTINGGRTWTAIHLPNSLKTKNLTGVSCPTVAVCVVVGYDMTRSSGLVLRTSDGGKHWTRAQVPTGNTVLSAVACASVTRCEAVGNGGSVAAIGTSDGTTWRARRIPASDYRGVTCPRRETCLVVGRDRNGIAAIFGTVDSGATWTRQKIG